MLEVTIAENGDVEVVQRHVEPMVYFDHWALRLFSDDGDLARRFTAALDRRGGTLAISWINLSEFIPMTDLASVRRVEIFLDQVLPRLFFIEPNPFTVIDHEDEVLLVGVRAEAPHMHMAMAGELVKLRPTPLTAIGMLEGLPGMLVEKRAEIANVFIEMVEALRAQYADDATFRAMVRAATTTERRPSSARFILRELVTTFLIDPSRRLTPNDAFDWFHAVVPASYCDLILLDGSWAAAINRVRETLRREGNRAPVAAAFSRRQEGVERFLQALERT
jgi:hypothetical protein